jgi:hypothetical protein
MKECLPPPSPSTPEMQTVPDHETVRVSPYPGLPVWERLRIRGNFWSGRFKIEREIKRR